MSFNNQTSIMRLKLLFSCRWKTEVCWSHTAKNSGSWNPSIYQAPKTMLFPWKTLPESYSRWSVFAFRFWKLDFTTFGMEINAILVKVSQEQSLRQGWNFLRACTCVLRVVSTRLLCPWDSPGKNTGVGCCFLLQGIFPTWYMWFIRRWLRETWVRKKKWSIEGKAASLVDQMVNNLPAMQETRVRSLGREDPQEEEMATHSSILAWRTPWTEEPGGTRLSD